MIKNISIKVTSKHTLDLVYVQGGMFMMGDPVSEFKDEKPVHQVVLSDFHLCKYLITQEVWEGVMGDNPSRFKGGHRPVERVSWLDTQEFIRKLNKETGENFRLPSESEWEYAARGGQYSQEYLYAGSDKLSQVGWYDGNSSNETKEVGQLLANELGLHDMSGNVWEWCADDWHENYDGAPNDGTAWVDRPRGSRRVLRGGSSFSDPINCRPTARNRPFPELRLDDIGIRLVLPLQSVK